MKSRGMIFAASSVLAILKGRKTQTRRIVKNGPEVAYSDPEKFRYTGGFHEGHDTFIAQWDTRNVVHQARCPYGKPGDRLWVRESFQPLLADGVLARDADYQTGEGYAVHYCAEGGVIEYIDAEDNIVDCITPSIFMPRWASRITLEITEVRVQRLQEITAVDAIYEGVIALDQEWVFTSFPEYHEKYVRWKMEQGAPPLGPGPVERYMKLWESINGAGSWAVNPWVWAVSFKRVQNLE